MQPTNRNTPLNPALSRFITPDSAIQRPARIALSLEALDKCGKTHYSLMTAPDPIYVITNDPGTEEVRKKAIRAGRVVHQTVLNYAAPKAGVRKQEEVDAALWKAWYDQWQMVLQVHDAIIQDRSIRTLVWDTATEIWHLAELAYFGKLMGNARQDKRTELNAAYSKLFWDVYKGRPDLNMILIHQLKKKYVKQAGSTNPNAPADWNGEYERDGFNKAGFHVDVCVRAGWDSVRRAYYSEIDATQPTRFGPELVGQRWYGEDNSFANLGLMLFPETEDTPEVWGL